MNERNAVCSRVVGNPLLLSIINRGEKALCRRYIYVRYIIPRINCSIFSRTSRRSGAEGLHAVDQENLAFFSWTGARGTLITSSIIAAVYLGVLLIIP